MNLLNPPVDGGSNSFDPLDRALVEASPESGRAGVIVPLISLIKRRYWTVIIATIVALVIGLVYILVATRQYTSESTLEIKRENTGVLNVGGADGSTTGFDQEFYETQYGLLKSNSLAERVVTDLRLQDDSQFFSLYGIEGGDEWFKDNRPVAASRDTRIKVAAALILKEIEVDSTRFSRLVTIRFTSPSPELSKKVMDAWARDFVKVTLERRYDATAYARKFLEDRLNQLRSRIDESQRRLVNYAAREGIVNLPTAGASTGGDSDERSLTIDKLAAVNSALAAAQAERAESEARLTGIPGVTKEALSNSAIMGLRQQRGLKSAQYSSLLEQFGPDYPAVQKLQAEVEQLSKAISSEESRIKSSLSQEYREDLQRESNLKDEVEKLRSNVLDERRRSIEYDIYRRDADTNRQLYDALLQRYKEIGVVGGVGVNNISVVDPASLPSSPSSPKILIIMALSLVLGLVIGGGVALLQEELDQGISNPEDVEAILGAPLLGTIPLSSQSIEEALNDPKSVVTEAYHSLQIHLAFSTDHGIPRSFAVTSTRPAEGKTTTSLALTQLLSKSKKRVLLIDADLRSPAVHKSLGLSNAKGLSNYLSGDSNLNALWHYDERRGFHVLTAGPRPSSPPELLAGERLADLLKIATEDFDHVVIDAPPVMGLADAPLIGNRVEGTIFVVEAHHSQKNMARVALSRLRGAHGKIFGVVLTKLDLKRADYGIGHGYGYGYGSDDQAAKA